jgi:hypothetical protein
VKALKKKETQDETQFTTRIGGKTSLGPSPKLAVRTPDFKDNSNILLANRMQYIV